MKKSIYRQILLSLLLSTSVVADTLSIQDQLEIIRNFMYVTGQLPPTQAAAMEDDHGYSGDVAIKCGTPAIADFMLNRDKLDPALLKALGVQAVARHSYAPYTEFTFDSPSGYFKIHYAKTGPDAVYQPNVDSDGDGVPDYVEATALIMDSVRIHEIDTLGYPSPPLDDFYPSGGDAKYDVYLRDFISPIFGQTWPDEQLAGPVPRTTSYLELDNDYSENIFRNYHGRPLDAIRVTAAHEYFHSIHFALDASEQEVDQVPSGQRLRRYWYEISAVWMEEEVYDDINDYYSYLDSFFVNPRISIQRFDNVFDLHPYASCIFAIFLVENYGRDIIRDIWLRCGNSAGPDFLQAAELELRNYIPGDSALPTAFRNFALWNFFTGARTYWAPGGMGYEEAENYPMIPLAELPRVTRYPHLQVGNRNSRKPEHLGAVYLQLENLYAIVTDSVGIDTVRISTCIDGQLDPCAVFVDLPVVAFDDSMNLIIGIGNGIDSTPPQPWGLTFLFRIADTKDSFVVSQTFLPYQDSIGGSYPLLKIVEPNQYHSALLIATPASYYYPAYRTPRYDYSFSHTVPEMVDSLQLGDTLIFIDSCCIDEPAAIMAPYPNPAIVSKMAGEPVRFRFQIPTDQASSYVYTNPSFTLDIFTLSGEFVKFLDSVVTANIFEKEIQFTVSWDMKNDGGKELASGVYLAVGRIFANPDHTDLIAEDIVKVAIIR